MIESQPPSPERAGEAALPSIPRSGGCNGVFYDRTASWWGSTAITAADRWRAQRIHAGSRAQLKVLELGAGCGGAAAATADLGHHILAVESSPRRAAFARRHQLQVRLGTLTVIEDDFNSVDLDEVFDVVAYWSGFGVGSDADQLDLLRRMRRWLAPGGRVVMDVFDPHWWQAARGRHSVRGGVHQALGFDARTRRLRVTCSLVGRELSAVTETVRCYDRDELDALACEARLMCSEYEGPGEESEPSFAPFGASASYLVQLVAA